MQLKLREAIELFDQSLGIKSEATRRWYARRLRTMAAYAGDVELTDVSVYTLRRWRNELAAQDTRWEDHPYRPTQAGKLAPWTLHGYVRAVRRFFTWCVEEDLLKKSPAVRLELPKLPRDEPPKAITEADLQLILEAAKTSSVRDYAIVRILADTACRVGGLAGLRLDDLKMDLRPSRATVREKGDKTRTIFFKPATANAVQAYLADRGQYSSNRLFIGLRGPLTESGIYSLLKRLARKAGVEGRFNPHSFRHAWARGAILKGADIAVVSDLLGHSDIQVTKRFYGRLNDEDRAKLHQQFSWVDDVEA